MKRLFFCILDLSFVLKFNGFPTVLLISCGEPILSNISLTCLASWLVYDFFAVFYFRIYVAFCFSSIDGCVSRDVIVTFLIKMPKVWNLTIPHSGRQELH